MDPSLRWDDGAPGLFEVDPIRYTHPARNKKAASTAAFVQHGGWNHY